MHSSSQNGFRDTRWRDRSIFIVAIIILIIAIGMYIFPQLSKKGANPLAVLTGADRVTIGWTQPFARDPAAATALQKLIGTFEAQNPGTTVVLDTREEGDIYGALNSSPTALGEVVSFDASQDLPGLEDSTNILSFPYLLFYNIDILTAAGFDRAPASRNDVAAMAEAVENNSRKKEGSIRGLDLCLSPRDRDSLYRDFYSWFWAAAIPLNDSNDGASPVLNFNRGAVKNVLAFFDTLIKKNILTTEALNRSGSEGFSDFLAGKAALVIAPSFKIAAAEKAGLHFGITPVPGPEELAGKPFLASLNWNAALNSTAIAAESEDQKKAASDFITFLTSQTDALSQAIYPLDESDSLEQKTQDIVSASSDSGNLEGLDRTKLTAIVHEQLAAYISGSQSTSQFAKKVQDKWDSGLSL
jgi:ABC-type glycerol-3-phosphate transport system substrate-binding protein